MTITSAFRFRPFSHVPGVQCLLPQTSLSLKIYPAKLVVANFEILFLNFGPMREFTATLDLEKNNVLVHGFVAQGYLCYHITANEKGFSLYFEKVPENFTGTLTVKPLYENKKIVRKDTFYFECSSAFTKVAHKERLHLGANKAQDAELIIRRKDLTEIIPELYFLSQSVPASDFSEVEKLSLYSEALAAVNEKNKEILYQKLYDFCRASFKSLFFPKLFDDEFLGYLYPALTENSKATPLCILKKCFQLIRRLFFYEEGSVLHILPALPKEFHAGKMVDLTTSTKDKISLEWTKKRLRQMTIVVKERKEFVFQFPSDVKTYRLQNLKTKDVLGEFTRDSQLLLDADATYLLDHFQK